MNLILGTANFGNDYGKRMNREECYRVLDIAKSLGVWAVDTAESYGESSNIIREWNGGLKIFSKYKKGEEYPFYADYVLNHDESKRMFYADGTSFYTRSMVGWTDTFKWIQAPFNPLFYDFKDLAHKKKFIARSIFCGGRMQKGDAETTARLVFGFLRSHGVQNVVFGVESVKELELIVRVSHEK